jgi:anaerobic selenocysteine-containing dehydrogenase
VVVVDPDFCSTAAKADEWLPIKADTDAALALGMARIIIERKLYDADFLRDFTDFPILVRQDNGKRLLAGEVGALATEAGSRTIPEYRRLFVIRSGGDFRILDPENLAATRAELEGEFEVTLADGSSVKVETVFTALQKLLVEYDLDKVAAITGLDPLQIERVAVDAATNTPLHLIYGASNYQWYNGDLKGRALSLLPVLTGSIGRSGAGISTYAGQYRIRFDLRSWWFPEGGKLNWVAYLHFLQGKGPNYPQNGIKAMVGAWGNPFDQHNMSNILKDRAASGELEFIMTTDFRMTTSCLWSDVVFPAPSWYEVFLNAGDAATRGIKDGDLVQIHNDRGKTRAYAILDPGCSAGTAIFEEGWWSRYLAGEGYNSLTFPWIKPLHEVYFVPGMWSPTTVWNECLVDVRRMSA